MFEQVKCTGLYKRIDLIKIIHSICKHMNIIVLYRSYIQNEFRLIIFFTNSLFILQSKHTFCFFNKILIDPNFLQRTNRYNRQPKVSDFNYYDTISRFCF